MTELAFWTPGVSDRQQASDEATAGRFSFQRRLPVAVPREVVASPSAGRAVTRGAHPGAHPPRLGMKSSFVMEFVRGVGPCRPAPAADRAFPNALRRGFRSMVGPSDAIGVGRALDLDTLIALPASYVGHDLRQRHGNLVWRVRFRNDRWLYLVLLLEFQPDIDRSMAVHMLTYTGLPTRG